MTYDESDLPLTEESKKMLIEIIDLAKKLKKESFQVAGASDHIEIFFDNENSLRYHISSSIIDEFEASGLIINKSEITYVLTPRVQKWFRVNRNPFSNFCFRLWAAFKKLFSTTWGIVIGIGAFLLLLLDIILRILQLLGKR